LEILDLLLARRWTSVQIAKQLRLPDHVPAIGGLSADKEVWLVEMRGQRPVEFSDRGYTILAARDVDAIGFVKCPVLAVPFRREAVGVEVKRVLFHPFHGGMLASGVVPGAIVDECGLGRYGRHDRR
jgi:hypothetical protein